jgi:Zn-dependent protease with chaperone function
MDFFEEQALARKRTVRLGVLFAVAVVGIVAAVYFLTLGLWSLGSREMTGVMVAAGQTDPVIAELSWWNPRVFVFACVSTALIIGIGSLYKTAQLRAGGAAIAVGLGGRKVDPDTTRLDERRLLNVVEEMAIASGIPAPEVYALDHEAGINAFAAGRTTSDSVIGVTHGTLQVLRRQELQGVIAHEFSHILNGDSRINMRAIGLLHGIFLLSLIGRFMLHGARRSHRKEGAAMVLTGVGLLLIGSVGVFFGRMLQSAISRQRELLADASAVQFTRNPDGLLGALKKIGGSSSIMSTPRADEASHIFFSEAMRRLRLFTGLFRTHPPIADRIRKLEPGWDGEFPEVALPKITDGLSTPPDAPAESFAAFADTPSEEAVDESLQHIGAPRRSQVEYAHSLHASLPKTWVHAVHQAPMAQAVAFALVLSKDEVARGNELVELAERTDPTTAELALRFHAESVDLASPQKIALVDMLIPTLRGLSEAEYARFQSALESLMKSDGRIDLFEYTLSRMIRRHLARAFEGAGPTPVRIRSLRLLVPDARVLLSTLARVGSRDDSEAARALRHGAKVLHLEGDLATLLPEAECTLSAVDASLLRYDSATPALKKTLMLACAATIMADDEITDREAELIRAIGDGIDCPVPPFVTSR